MLYKRLKRIACLQFFFLLLKLTPGSLAAQTNGLAETILPLIEARLEQPGGDTATYFIQDQIRAYCGNDTDCLYNAQNGVLRMLESRNLYWTGIPVAVELTRLAEQKGEIDAEIDALRRLIELYNFTNDTKMTIFYREKLLELFEREGNQAGVIETKTRILEGRAWLLNETDKVLPEIEAMLAKAIDLNLTETANNLRLRLKYLYEEFGHYDKLAVIVEELEKLVASDSIRFSKSGYGFHAASGRADLLLMEGKYAQAEALYQKALGISRLYYRGPHDTWSEIYALHRLAKLEWERHNGAKAKSYLDTAYAISAENKMYGRLVINLEMKAQIAEAEHRFADALRFTREMYAHAASADSISAGFDVKKYYLQIEAEKLAAEKEKQAIEIRLKNDQVAYLTLIGVLTSLLAAGLYIGFSRQRKGKKQLAVQNSLIQRQSQQLKQLDMAKSRFFANVSHELRTPLSLMLGPIRTLLVKEQPPEKRIELLRMADQGGKNLEMLVNEILDLGKMEAGKMELDMRPVQAMSFFRHYFAQFESLAQYNGVTYRFSTETGDAQTVLLDKEKCRQIVYNLLSNAFKFTPPGGSVDASMEIKNGQLVLEVTDTGEGIHPDDLPHVFDRYFQTKRPDATATGGMGIGLALCHEYAKLFKGNISVKSTLGTGTAFRVVFPVEALPANDLPSTQKELYADFRPRSSKTQKPRNPETQKPSILIVEDSPELQAYFRMVLENDFHVTTAGNGAEAWQLLNGEPHGVQKRPVLPSPGLPATGAFSFDLIISDLMMPVMDGYQLVEKLKEEEATRHLPIIMLTARANQDDRLKALRIGVDDYLTKPFDEEELKARINNLLANQAGRKSAATEMGGKTDAPVLSQTDQEWLGNFEAYVQQNLSNDVLTVAFLAQEFAMSESTLFRQVKRLTGLSSKQYIQEVRLDAARLLLENRTYRSVSQVAEKVGFARPRTFSRSFKERYGRSPHSFFKD